MVARPHNVKTMKAMCSNLSKRWAVRLAALGMWACALLAVACDGSQGGDFNNAGGKPYELVVSVPQEAWVGEVGDTLRAVSNETGRFTIPEVPTGKATVILEAAGYKRSTVEIDIEDNPRHRVHKHFEMEKAGDERDL